MSSIKEQVLAQQGQYKELSLIHISFEMEWKLKDATFFVPQRGDKKHLLQTVEFILLAVHFRQLQKVLFVSSLGYEEGCIFQLPFLFEGDVYKRQTRASSPTSSVRQAILGSSLK